MHEIYGIYLDDLLNFYQSKSTIVVSLPHLICSPLPHSTRVTPSISEMPVRRLQDDAEMLGSKPIGPTDIRRAGPAIVRS